MSGNETETFVELHANTGESRSLKGDGAVAAYRALRNAATEFRAVAHDHDGNTIPSTLFHVIAPAGQLQGLVDKHADHTDHGVGGAVYRGLRMRPGTPTSNAVNQLATDIQSATGEDITTVDSPEQDFQDHPDSTAGGEQSAADFLKNDRPGHDTSSEDYTPPFDVTNWLVG